jgi:regulator of protease activity HflC (stomatin/prohibitin superfamily)
MHYAFHATEYKAMNQPTNPPPVPPPRKSGCGTGCLISVLIVLVIAGSAGYFGWRFVKNQYTTVMERFEREGYRRVEGQVIEVTERVNEPTIYVAQVVKIRAGSNRGLAFLCQQADIQGDVVGNVHFIGQVLNVDKDAILHRDLDIKAQVANVYGVVSGEVTGVWQILKRTPDE